MRDAVQEHNRELLADANREVDVQHEIAVELAQLSHSVAALEIGSAITDLSLTGGAIKGDVVGQVNWYRKEVSTKHPPIAIVPLRAVPLASAGLFRTRTPPSLPAPAAALSLVQPSLTRFLSLHPDLPHRTPA